MEKNIYKMSALAVILTALFVFGGKNEVFAEVNINIDISPPPIFTVEPPEVIVVPGSSVFFVPIPDIDVFFYSGWWWSPRGGKWYRTKDYNGQWVIIDKRYVPAPLFIIPKDYRRRYDKEKHIPYGQWRKEGRDEEKEEHGERKEHKREHRKENKHEGKGHGH